MLGRSVDCPCMPRCRGAGPVSIRQLGSHPGAASGAQNSVDGVQLPLPEWSGEPFGWSGESVIGTTRVRTTVSVVVRSTLGTVVVGALPLLALNQALRARLRG